MVIDQPQVLSEPADEVNLLIDAVRSSQVGDEPVRVLEAGCGKRWVARPDGVPLHLTGIDSDPETLRIRHEENGDLDVTLNEDLRTVPLEPGSFDVVYCSYVLEHIAGAADVLDRFATALRPGGRLVIRVPDGDSVYGFVTKNTPHRVHILYKRYMEHKPNAGKVGYGPFPTVYDPVISVRGLRGWAAKSGFTVEHEYSNNFFVNNFGRLKAPISAALNGVAALSRGRLTAEHSNIGFIMVKAD